MNFFIFRVCFSIFVLASIAPEFIQVSKAQSSTSDHVILLQLQQQLEYPTTLESWQNWTDFCYFQPTSSVTIACLNRHVTEITIIGNKTSSSSHNSLSQKFNIESLFTVLTKLTTLKKLSLVSLGIWGTLPPKVGRLRSLEVLNMSSNFITGQIPDEVGSMLALKSLALNDNQINGNLPDLSELKALQELDLSNNNIGPNYPSLGPSLTSIILRNNSIRSSIPSQMKYFDQLERFDVSSNHIVGPFPAYVLSLPSLWYLNLDDNLITGDIPKTTSCGKRLWYVDVSRNLLVGDLPACIGPGSAKYRKVLSLWNCLLNMKFQHPVNFCQRQALAVIPPPKKNGSSKNSADGGSISGIRLGLIFGVIGGSILLVGTACCVVWLICKQRSSVEALNQKPDRSVAAKSPFRPSPVIETSSKTLLSSSLKYDESVY
ncbi:hypothetical protein vseg_002076 [Gypsophila vaccaria]